MLEPARSEMELLLRRILLALRRPPAPIKEEILGRLADEIAAMFPPMQIPGNRPRGTCWCGEQSCNEHSQFEVGDG